MKWFPECKTLEEVKSLYKSLAKQHHPDLGGDTATMQEINNEYAFASAKILNGQNLSDQDLNDEIRFSEDYQKIVEKIINLPGIVVELVGRWIWVSGDTFPVRKELKDAGLLFAPKKKVWYYRSEEYKVMGGGKKTLDEIKKKYGSETINNKRGSKNITD